MDECAQILVHPSKFPKAQRRRWQKALADRSVPPGFLYEGLSQADKWLALHRAFSPAQTNPACIELYSQAFISALRHLKGPLVHLAGICPGDATKERGLIELLRADGKIVHVTAADTSKELLLEAYANLTTHFKGVQMSLICMELEQCSTLPALLKGVDPSGSQRIVTFFGTLHNFHPGRAFGQILKGVRSEDLLIFSANLAPETGYDTALQDILQGYDNETSKAWFWGGLANIGLTPAHGMLTIGSEKIPAFNGLKQITARFRFRVPSRLQVMGHSTDFSEGEELLLFFSARFTGNSIRQLIAQHRMNLVGAWETEEEGVYLCMR